MTTYFLDDKKVNKTPCVLLLGGFDGVHLGHRRLLSRAKEFSLPIGIMTIIGGKGEQLFTLEERKKTFAKVGIDFCVVMAFEKICSLSPEQFLTLLQEKFEIEGFVCGDDFRFGYKASGSIETLKELSKKKTFVEELLMVDGAKVSASGVKKLLSNGEIEKANELLGERFFLTGEVVEGRKIGRTMSFPTANIDYPKEKHPLKKGVYETRVAVDGKEYRGITNFGARPTFHDETVCTETYLVGYDGDLYGKQLTVEFVRYLRGVQKFASVDELKNQLKKDVERVRE